MASPSPAMNSSLLAAIPSEKDQPRGEEGEEHPARDGAEDDRHHARVLRVLGGHVARVDRPRALALAEGDDDDSGKDAEEREEDDEELPAQAHSSSLGRGGLPS